MAQETPQQKLARESGTAAIAEALQRLVWPRDALGTPLIKISAAQAELVPTVQFGNCTVGPVVVEKFIPDGPPEQLKEEIKALRQLCDEAVAEDRQTLHEQIRARAAAGG